jgi:hypothetical protein
MTDHQGTLLLSIYWWDPGRNSKKLGNQKCYKTQTDLFQYLEHTKELKSQKLTAEREKKNPSQVHWHICGETTLGGFWRAYMVKEKSEKENL